MDGQAVTAATPELLAVRLSSLERARKARAEGVALNPIQKSEAQPQSLRLAINAKCYDCQGQDADPGWRQRIADCNDVACPLVPVRPYQQKGKR